MVGVSIGDHGSKLHYLHETVPVSCQLNYAKICHFWLILDTSATLPLDTLSCTESVGDFYVYSSVKTRQH